MKGMHENMMSTNSIANFLKQCDIFYQFSATQLELVANLCQQVTYQKDELVFKENSRSKELYVIAEGSIDIVVDPSLVGMQGNNVTHEVIATLRRGQSFGEVALVDEGIRSASAFAAQDGTRLFIIPRNKLIALCDTDPQLGYKLMYNLGADLAMKIRNTSLRIRETVLYTPKDQLAGDSTAAVQPPAADEK